jgi:hypothetical protein
MSAAKLALAGIFVAVALALVGCGSSSPKPPCAVLANGNQLCGNALVAWCELNQVGINGPEPNSPTYQACLAASNWQDRGKKVIDVSPNSNGKSLNETTTTAPQPTQQSIPPAVQPVVGSPCKAKGGGTGMIVDSPPPTTGAVQCARFSP